MSDKSVYYYRQPTRIHFNHTVTTNGFKQHVHISTYTINTDVVTSKWTTHLIKVLIIIITWWRIMML